MGLVSAEDEDLTVMEDEPASVSSLKGRGETTAKSKERALSALHVRFDEVGLCRGSHVPHYGAIPNLSPSACYP